MPKPQRVAALFLVVAASVVAPGCGNRLQDTVGLTNQRPVVRLESTSIPAGDGQMAAAHLRWIATDPDGRVDHFLVSEDPAAFDRESGWAKTTEREQVLRIRRATPATAGAVTAAAPGFSFFAVRAVDERGARSEPEYLAFFGDDVAPTVQIIQPIPNRLITPTVPPAIWIHWQGSDPDGPNGRPAKYKYQMFRRGSGVPWEAWLADPDSLRRQFAPGFAGWDSISGDSTRVHYQNLVVSSEHLFAITALDAEGAYDPIFSLDKNLLRLHVVPLGTLGPRITLFNEFITYTYPAGGIPSPLDSSWIIRIQAPAGRPLTVNWYAEALQGSSMGGYRWALDIADIADETARRGRFDLQHWTEWSLGTTSTTLDPRPPTPLTGTHRLYVEAMDENGLVSLGILQFRFVQPTFDRDLLIVDDTRFRPDMRSSTQPPGRTDSLRAPIGAWPSAAELDTFLFAVGGKRWRMTPDGTLSPTGVFAGYSYDTLGTRHGLYDPTVPLNVLGQYKHIIWMTDALGSSWVGPPNSPTMPITTLAYMSRLNRQNTLATWVEGGGRLWALGGGFGNATNTAWNNVNNDLNAARVYSSLGLRPDLGPGRFMYDLTHWQSEFRVYGPFTPAVARAPFTSAGLGGANVYTLLPARLRSKSPATDPLWPYRTVSDFYVGNPIYSPKGIYLEYLSLPDTILEAKNPSPRHQNEIQALDTLMVATAPQLPVPGSNPAVDRIVNPVMTYYYGGDCGPVVFSGFDCWAWSRADLAQLVDAVLQGVWGLTREAGAVTPGARAPVAAKAAVVRPSGN